MAKADNLKNWHICEQCIRSGKLDDRVSLLYARRRVNGNWRFETVTGYGLCPTHGIVEAISAKDISRIAVKSARTRTDAKAGHSHSIEAGYRLYTDENTRAAVIDRDRPTFLSSDGSHELEYVAGGEDKKTWNGAGLDHRPGYTNDADGGIGLLRRDDISKPDKKIMNALPDDNDVEISGQNDVQAFIDYAEISDHIREWRLRL